MKKDSLIIHHGGNNNSFYATNSYHKSKWNFKSELGFYIGYQYWIETNGKLMIGRTDEETGAHKKGWNERSIGICLRGNLETKKPTNQQLNTLRKLLQDLQKCHSIPKEEIYAHQELSQTLCPGKYLMPFIKDYRAYKVVEDIETPPEPSDEPTQEELKGFQKQLDKIKGLIINIAKQIYELFSKKRN